MRVEREAGRVLVMDGGELVAEGGPAGMSGPELPHPVGLEAAVAAASEAERGITSWAARHPFPTCFVCGPQREPGDGLRLFAWPVQGLDVLATVWTPGPDLAADDGWVRPEFVWSALDCPSGAAAMRSFTEGAAVLGTMEAGMTGPVRSGAAHAVVAWRTGAEGRKILSASAIFTSAGELVAHANAVWVRLKTEVPPVG